MIGTLLSIGHGYSAAALARRLIPAGWRVIGTTRDQAKAARFAAEGVTSVAWPLADPDRILAEADAVLSSVPPCADGDPVLEALGPALAAADLCWIGYLSTTGVYGDHAGGWVDETSPVAPSTARGAARAAAEAAWLDLWRAAGAPIHIFRLAGIYGPGRAPFDRIRSGAARRIVKPGQVFSRIHVDDLAAVLSASLAQPSPGAIYNVCDDLPAPPEDVLAYAAELIGALPPPAIAWEDAAPEMSPMARSFYAESKRVSNRRIKEDLGVRLAYPDYREGLAATLAATLAVEQGGG
jgi:nucleoside-diphosphate-sugar epimerase